MLVLLSFGLVLVATVLLVLGLLADGGLGLIYVSIALSVAAGVVLVIATRMAKPKEGSQATGPEPLVAEPAMALAGATAPPVAAPPPPPAPTIATPAMAPPAEPVTEDAGEDDGEWLAADHDWQDEDEGDDEDDEFPIADYDDLKVAEVMPLLPQLYTDELDVVEERERAGKARATVLAEIDRLRRQAFNEPEPPPVPTAPVPAVTDVRAFTDEDDEAFFPIEDYDELSAAEIISVLGELDDDELRDVRAHEAEHQARRTVLTNIDRRLGLVPPPPPPRKRAVTAVRKAPPAKKAAANSAKKAAPAKKAAAPTARKAAAPAKKTAAPVAKKAAAPAKKATTATTPTKATRPTKKAE